ncbi:MAG: ABC transporter ATP-binding protein, partial [Patescibacteria group bacterium]
IYQNIFSAFGNKAIVSSVHRLRLLPMFDRIYFFRGGSIIAHGTFKELFENSKDFKHLWERHAGAHPSG